MTKRNVVNLIKSSALIFMLITGPGVIIAVIYGLTVDMVWPAYCYLAASLLSKLILFVDACKEVKEIEIEEL